MDEAAAGFAGIQAFAPDGEGGLCQEAHHCRRHEHFTHASSPGEFVVRGKLTRPSCWSRWLIDKHITSCVDQATRPHIAYWSAKLKSMYGLTCYL
jgi:hypothetical protein